PSLAMLEPGDVVLSVDGVRVKNRDDLIGRLDRTRAGALMLFEVRRGAGVRFVGVQAPGQSSGSSANEPTASKAPETASSGPAPAKIIIVLPNGATAPSPEQMQSIAAYATGDPG